MKSKKLKNPVAKNSSKFNKSSIQIDRKKESKRKKVIKHKNKEY